MTAPTSPPRWLLVAAVLLAAAVLAGCAGAAEPGDSELVGTRAGIPLPDVTLTDTGGQPFDLRADTDAAVTLVFFGYTHCPDQCPITAATVTTALGNLAPATRQQVEFLFITADPARDTPGVIREWLDRFDPGYRGLTGPMRTIRRVAGGLGVPLGGRTPPVSAASGAYDVSHGLQVFAFGRDDRSLVVWTGSVSIAAVTHDLRRLL